MRAMVAAAFAGGRVFRALCLSLVFSLTAIAPSLAAPPWAQQDELVYAGRCGLFLHSPRPSQKVWYRYDLRRWRYGDERDFNCFILENY